MINKAATLYFNALVVSAVLLLASELPAFGQANKGSSEPQSPDAASRAEELFKNALLLSDNQERESARLRLQEAMRLWLRLGAPGKAAKAAQQMGDRSRQAGKYRDALDYYKEALEIKLPPGPVRTNSLIAIAQVCAELYQNNLAIRYFSTALGEARIIGDLVAQTLVLTELANVYYRQGEKVQALTYIKRARHSSQQSKAGPEPTLLCLLGRISQEEGLVDTAKAAFEEALAIYRKASDIEGVVRVLSSISALSLLCSQKQTAFDQAGQALELAEGQAKRAVSQADKVRARDLRWRAWLSRARAARALGRKKDALKSYDWAINHFEGMWWARYIVTEASAIALREEIQTAYREYVDLLMEQGQFNKAYELAEQGKARTILNRTWARRVTPPSRDNNQEATLRELNRYIARRRLELLGSDISLDQQANLKKEIEGAEYKIQEIQLRTDLEHSRDLLVWSNLATADPLKKKMAHDQMALAEFSLGENRSFIWLFAHGDVFHEVLPARKEIEKAVRSYLDVLAATPNHLHIERDIAKVRKQGEALFSTLFGHLSRQIKPGQRLIIVPDGLLHYLPFEALIHNGRYLVEDHETSYTPSASMLGLWQDSGSGSVSGDQMELLAFGDPVFEPEPKAVGVKGSMNAFHNKARQMLAARGFHLARLPRTRDEVQDITGLFPRDRRKVLLGREGTEEAFKREPLHRYRRLHFATHSLIDEKFPLRSAVVLTPGDGAEEDGFLDVSEISRLDLDCDLVVVSACQTGRGQLLSGEGIVGLSRAFLYAGARSVVVSLWNVTDISTGQLMKNFYQNLTGGMSNAAALRKAKLQMFTSSKQTRHPYYWSSFVMVGKP